jgi:tetratricopeptide (TPR) repeat protein
VASKRAVGIARASGDTRLRGNTLAEWGGNLVMVGRFDDALTATQEATHLAEVAGDLTALCTAHRAMIGTYINKGDLVQARTAGDRAVEVAERLGDPEVMALAWASRALVTMLTGQWDLARDDLERALALARGIASAVTMRFALTGYGRYCLYTGDWEQAVRLFEEAITMDDQEVPAVQGFLADLDLATGHPFRARERLAPYYERTSRHLWINETRPVYARACLETGDLERAEALLTDHMVWVEQTGKRQGKVEGLRVRGILAARRGQWEDAARDFAEALTVARQMSMPYAQARILDAWGTMHDSRGESVRACTLLLESLTLFSRLGAQKDIERVNGHLVQLKAESLIPPSALRTAPGNTPRTTRP